MSRRQDHIVKSYIQRIMKMMCLFAVIISVSEKVDGKNFQQILSWNWTQWHQIECSVMFVKSLVCEKSAREKLVR